MLAAVAKFFNSQIAPGMMPQLEVCHVLWRFPMSLSSRKMRTLSLKAELKGIKSADEIQRQAEIETRRGNPPVAGGMPTAVLAQYAMGAHPWRGRGAFDCTAWRNRACLFEWAAVVTVKFAKLGPGGSTVAAAHFAPDRAFIVKVTPWLDFVKPPQGDQSLYFSACRYALCAYYCFPNPRWRSRAELMDADGFKDEDVEAVLTEFVKPSTGVVDAHGVEEPGSRRCMVDLMRQQHKRPHSESVWNECPGFLRTRWKKGKDRQAREEGRAARRAALPSAEVPRAARGAVRALTWNVWFNVDVHGQARMQALGRAVREHSPDIVALQEVTPRTHSTLAGQKWWRSYEDTVPPPPQHQNPGGYYTVLLVRRTFATAAPGRVQFAGAAATEMGRDMRHCMVNVFGEREVAVCTVHLESPQPGESAAARRAEQLRTVGAWSTGFDHVLILGYFNWLATDGDITALLPATPLMLQDAWTAVHGADGGEAGQTWRPTVNTNCRAAKNGFRLVAIQKKNIPSKLPAVPGNPKKKEGYSGSVEFSIFPGYTPKSRNPEKVARAYIYRPPKM